MSDHEHVTVDEAVFQAYQDVAFAAWRVLNGADPEILRRPGELLDECLKASDARAKADPTHHLAEA